MLRLSRSFSKLAQQVLNVDSLKYKYPWNLSQAGSIKISTVKSQHYLKAFSILASTYTKDVNILEIWLREMEKKLASEGFSYTINRDYVNLNMVGDENIRYQLMRILELMKNAETGNVKHRRIDEDIESILVRSCFEMPVLKLSQPLFTGEYFVASSLDLKESDFSQFDKNIITPSEPQEYKAAMVLVESPQDSCEISLAFKSPSFLSPDYFLFKFLSHFLSTDNSYTLDVSKQFNYLNSLFSGIPGIYSHSCKLYNGLKSSLIIHTLQTHPYSSTLAAASILKANKRACQEIILYELERTQGLILNSMLKDKPFLSSCMNRNFEVYSNKNESDFKDFVINLNEEYIVGGLSKYLKSQFPSIVVKGKIYSDNVIENIFNIKL